MESPDPLPDAAVAPEAYTEEYYLSSCGHHEEWVRSGGREIGGIYAHVIDRVGLVAGEMLVDIGAGRGELIAAAAKRGASAVGIEYSEAAVELARRTLEVNEAGDLARIELADARRLPLEDGVADVVALLDVVEHLTPQELAGALSEARRVLAPGGRLIAHTFPNRLIYEVTYRVQRLAPWRRSWPRDPRVEGERLMHVNEQTRRSLEKAVVAAGFSDVRVTYGDWVYTDFVPTAGAKRTYRLLARLPGLRGLGLGNLWAEARG